jgi:hypothetical protein
MLKHNEVNPLNVFGLRRLDHCPPHFEVLCFDLKTQEKNITDWIYENLSSRFFFGEAWIPNPESGLTICNKVGFEDSRELSYFGMFLDTINVYDFSFQ